MAKKEMCKCKVNEAEEPHNCPYDIEMSYPYEKDDLSMCNCCDECEANCAGDI